MFFIDHGLDDGAPLPVRPEVTPLQDLRLCSCGENLDELGLCSLCICDEDFDEF